MIRLLALSLYLGAASATAAGVGVQVDLNPIVPLGKKPTLNVVIKDRLKSIVVTLTRSDGTVIKRKHKRPRRGTPRAICVESTTGHATLYGRIDRAFRQRIYR